MHPEVKALVDAWREAERLAAQAEKDVNDVLHVFLDGKGPAPTPEASEAAAQLRRRANDAFERAQDALDGARRAIRRSGGPSDRWPH